MLSDFLSHYYLYGWYKIWRKTMRFGLNKKVVHQKWNTIFIRRIIFFIFLLLILFFTAKYLYRSGKYLIEHVCKIEQISLLWDDVCVTTPREELVNYLNQKMTDTNFLFFDRNKFYSDLKNTFGWVKDISWKRNGFNSIQCKVIGYKPICYINDEMLVLENGMFMGHSQCDHDLVVTLPSVVIDQQLLQYSLLDDQTLLFCMNINTMWLNDYVITYHDTHEIIVQPKKYKHITLIADQVSLQEGKKFQAIELILKDLHKKKILYFSRWFEQQFSFMLDLRFKDRIVVKRFSRARETGSGS